jgi:hypothetical protein
MKNLGTTGSVLLVIVLFMSATGFLPASVIDIITHQNLLFGTLMRQQTKSVAYTSPEAGLFELRGESRKNVKITVSVYTVSLNENQLTLTIRPQDIAYSKDGGITWTECTSLTLSWTTQFPRTTGGIPSVILVRVGGTISTNAGQQRGEYRGTVRLKGAYSN